MDNISGQTKDAQVCQYNIEEIGKIISEFSQIPFERLKEKYHYSYFKNYFDHEQAKTVILEYDYIDSDYLEDYAEFYVKCFKDYKKHCLRLHYFTDTFSNDDFLNILFSSNTDCPDPFSEEQLKSSYIGFMVIRPLPNATFGRTCLKTYSSDGVNIKRFYSATRNYKVNLFGIELLINNTLAFQEQDSTVAVCASSSLWSLFHATSDLFHHSIPAPVKITEDAVKKFPSDETSKLYIPGKGLSFSQMDYAVQSSGLRAWQHYVSEKKDKIHIVKSLLYAYLRGKVPVSMVVCIFDPDNPDNDLTKNYHAVTVTGFGLAEENTKAITSSQINIIANKISKIYVHDDQVGPFSRMTFDEKVVIQTKDKTKNKYEIMDNDLPKLSNEIKRFDSLSTFWYNEKGRAIPQFLLIPLYHKIRIPFEDIYQKILLLNDFFFHEMGNFPELDEARTLNQLYYILTNIEWDIFLTTVNQFKSEIRTVSLKSKRVENILLTRMPRFLWRVIARCKLSENKKDSEINLFEILFDATDIKRGSPFFEIFSYSQYYSDEIMTLIEKMARKGFAKQ